MSTYNDTPSSAVASEIDKLFVNGILKNPVIRNGNATRQSYPPMDVREDENSFVLSADMPGLERDEVEVLFVKGHVVISGERKQQSTDSQFLKTEILYGKFYRRVQLPSSIDPESIEATLRNGVLTVVVSKSAEAKPKRITVKQ